MSARSSRMGTKSREKAETIAAVALEIQARIPGHGSFIMTGDAAAMIRGFGGTLRCFVGGGGCRK